MEDIDLSSCFCGDGYDRPMIRCCCCKRWYHINCIHATRHDLENASKYYCFECIDLRPDSDSGDDYNFSEDKQRRREINRETRKRVKMMLKDDTFNKKSVESMDENSLLNAICCIEQQLLTDDITPSVHAVTSRSEFGLSEYQKGSNKNHSMNDVFQSFRSVCADIERANLQNTVCSVNQYLSIKEGNSHFGRQLIRTEEQWMLESRKRVDEIGFPTDSVAINADVRTFDWKSLGCLQKCLSGRLFDVVMMDPPWQLSNSDPSRGVTINYEKLDDESISSIPIGQIQDCGLLFLWTINAKYMTAIRMIRNWGYKIVGDIAWVKLSSRGFMIQSNAFYLQHAKETCFIAQKGNCQFINPTKIGKINDVIYSKRKGQSQKPDEIYSLIEELVPEGYYIEVFGRRNNLRDNWVTIGNEI